MRKRGITFDLFLIILLVILILGVVYISQAGLFHSPNGVEGENGAGVINKVVEDTGEVIKIEKSGGNERKESVGLSPEYESSSVSKLWNWAKNFFGIWD